MRRAVPRDDGAAYLDKGEGSASVLCECFYQFLPDQLVLYEQLPGGRVGVVQVGDCIHSDFVKGIRELPPPFVHTLQPVDQRRRRRRSADRSVCGGHPKGWRRRCGEGGGTVRCDAAEGATKWGRETKVVPPDPSGSGARRKMAEGLVHPQAAPRASRDPGTGDADGRGRVVVVVRGEGRGGARRLSNNIRMCVFLMWES